MKNLSIYIHIPFCSKKCSYCDFLSVARPESEFKIYLDRLKEEFKLNYKLASSYNINTVYIGGGTPSILPEYLLKLLLSEIKSNFNLANVKEFTFECNPESITREKLELLKEFGVNRLSIGLQTTDENELEILRRGHSFQEFINAYHLARELNFDNISLDLMFAIPNQTIVSLSKTLADVVKLNPEHISCYSLIIEENTLMHRWLNESRIKPSDDNDYVEMYRETISFLEKHDYNQYEISNFSKLGYESLHNSSYWISQDYLGLGASSHSLIQGKRYANHSNLKIYLEEEFINIDTVEQLTNKDVFNEGIFLGLRLNKGISLSKTRHNILQLQESFLKHLNHEEHFQHDHGGLVDSNGNPITLIEKFDNTVKDLMDINLLELNKDNIKLTQKGRELSNTVFSRLMI